MSRRATARATPRHARTASGGLRLALLLLSGTLALACGRAASPPPATAPVPERAGAAQVPAEEDPRVAAVRESAERHFRAGKSAYERGNYSQAREQFERAFDVYLNTPVPEGAEEQFQEAFNDLFGRIHVLGLDELTQPDQLVELEVDELPEPGELDDEELARLRARLEASLPDLPRFTLPVPVDNDRVLAALRYLTTERRDVIEEGLTRAGRYIPMILSIFEEEGVPPELAWVPLIESLFKPNAYSRAAAAGMWQFMSGTARLLGLRVDWSVDERRDPIRATRAAAAYLKELHQRMDGNWDMALASYNAGWGRVQRAAARVGSDDYWEIVETRALPRETRDFVAKIYAAILIGTDPEFYGFDVEPLPPLEWDNAVVDSPTDIRVLADSAGTTLEVIQELNPHLRAVTPNVDEYVVRVPAGRKAAFEEALAAIPPSERVEFIEYRVARGDTLGTIAARFATPVSAIQEMNGIRNRHRIREGQRLVIPVGGERRVYTGRRLTGFDHGQRLVHDVRRGETLGQIAGSYGTSVRNLRRWNDLRTDLIFPGDELVVYFGVTGDEVPTAPVATAAPAGDDGSSGSNGGASTSEGSRAVYTVRRGDSLYTIAQRFDVTVDDLQRWNGRLGNTTIFPGDMLVVYSDAAVFDDRASADAATSVHRYTVRRGDSPYEIARRFNVSLEALLAANSLTRTSRIYPGDELLIPGVRGNVGTYTVRRGDTLGSIASRLGIPLRNLLQANGLTRQSTIYPGDRLVVPGR